MPARQPVANGAHHAFLLGRDADQVVADIGRRGLEAAPALFARAAIGLVEQVELELGGEEGGEPAFLQPRHLALENGAGRMREVGMRAGVEDVAQNQCGLFQPGRQPQRRKVGLEHEVAIAFGPICGLVAGDGLHIDVVGEQVIAAMRLLMRRGDEVGRMKALADQAALHVDAGAQHGVHGPFRDQRAKRVETQVCRHRELRTRTRPPRERAARARGQALA